MSSRRAFVTGGTGFVGSHLLAHLTRVGYEVTALRRKAPEDDSIDEGVRWIRGDLADRAALRAGTSAADVVFHLAADVIGASVDAGSREGGVADGTSNVIEAAVEAGVPRFVHISSEVVYDPRSENPITEESPLVENLDGIHPYVLHKILAEQALWQADTLNRIEATCIRPARVLGPGDPNLLGVMANLFTLAMGQVRDDSAAHVPVVVVDELVEGIERAGSSSLAAHRSYNLGGTEPVTKGQLRQWFADAGFTPPAGSIAKRGALLGLRTVMDLARLAIPGGRGRDTRIAVRMAELLERRLESPLRDRIYESRRAAQDLQWTGSADCRDAVARAVHSANLRE